MCRCIIAGSGSEAAVEAAVTESGFQVTEVISGELSGSRWAEHHHVPCCAPEGNLALVTEALILLWDGKNPDGVRLFRQVAERGLPLYLKLT